MNCCEKAVTDYLVREALLIPVEHPNSDIPLMMIDGAGVSMSNADDAKIINNIGPKAVEMLNELAI
ncbi:MAG: hypothetical protein COB22_05895 [Cycloclasticus sp.]|nr:MAG: hypothetical protein COB22_05895 [Cycloclasticus sp.]